MTLCDQCSCMVAVVLRNILFIIISCLYVCVPIYKYITAHLLRRLFYIILAAWNVVGMAIL
jgi:hypothetical protein